MNNQPKGSKEAKTTPLSKQDVKQKTTREAEYHQLFCKVLNQPGVESVTAKVNNSRIKCINLKSNWKDIKKDHSIPDYDSEKEDESTVSRRANRDAIKSLHSLITDLSVKVDKCSEEISSITARLTETSSILSSLEVRIASIYTILTEQQRKAFEDKVVIRKPQI